MRQFSQSNIASVLVSFGLSSGSWSATDRELGLKGTLLRVAGSHTMAPLLAEIGRRYSAQHPAVKFDILATSSGHGVAAVREGRAEMGMVARALDPAEHDLYGIPIARDGVAVVVHRDNPVTQMTEGQLQAVYRGVIRNWQQLGGGDHLIHVLGASAEAGASHLFPRYIGARYETLVIARLLEPNRERLAAVATDPHAIAYASLAEAEAMVAEGAPLRMLPAGGIQASSANVRSGAYPVARPLTLVCHGVPTGAVRSFFAFCLSAQAIAVVRELGFLPYLE